MKLKDINIASDIDEEFARSDEEMRPKWATDLFSKKFADLLSLELQGDFFFFFLMYS